jgi:hypothetical protein
MKFWVNMVTRWMRSGSVSVTEYRVTAYLDENIPKTLDESENVAEYDTCLNGRETV